MVTKTDLQDAHREWNYEENVGSFGQDFTISIPCQLRFVGEVDQETERFHTALEDRGFSPLDSDPDRRATDEYPHYEGEACSTDHYNRIKILVFRGGVVRLYPKDKYIPTHRELKDVAEALEEGFGAELEHDPINRNGRDGGDR